MKPSDALQIGSFSHKTQNLEVANFKCVTCAQQVVIFTVVITQLHLPWVGKVFGGPTYMMILDVGGNLPRMGNGTSKTKSLYSRAFQPKSTAGRTLVSRVISRAACQESFMDFLKNFDY